MRTTPGVTESRYMTSLILTRPKTLPFAPPGAKPKPLTNLTQKQKAVGKHHQGLVQWFELKQSPDGFSGPEASGNGVFFPQVVFPISGTPRCVQ